MTTKKKFSEITKDDILRVYETHEHSRFRYFINPIYNTELNDYKYEKCCILGAVQYAMNGGYDGTKGFYDFAKKEYNTDDIFSLLLLIDKIHIIDRHNDVFGNGIFHDISRTINVDRFIGGINDYIGLEEALFILENWLGWSDE